MSWLSTEAQIFNLQQRGSDIEDHLGAKDAERSAQAAPTNPAHEGGFYGWFLA